MLRLEGKVALVSGASKGIGAGIAKGLAAAGAQLKTPLGVRCVRLLHLTDSEDYGKQRDEVRHEE